ncbi:MAG: TlpA disulfide reductase family protein [Bacteroidota bacterium]
MIRFSIFFILTYFLIFITDCFAQNITIKGKTTGYEGEEISVIVYDDYLAFTEKELAASKIDDEGNFELIFPPPHKLLRKDSIPYTTYAKIRIDETDKTLYIEPGLIYEIIFPHYNADLSPSPDTETEKQIEFINADDKELNIIIRDFNIHYNEFIYKYYPILIQGGGKAKADSFIVMMNEKYSNPHTAGTGTGNSYFKTFMHYKFASIEQITLKNNKKLMEEKYILSVPVKSSHYEYMDFITHYFSNHLLMKSLSPEGEGITTIVNVNKSYEELMRDLGKDKLLNNDTLRELILLKGLHEIYYKPEFKKNSILDILDSIGVKSQIAEHKKIAQNIKKLLLKLSSGSKAPDFELFDQYGNLVKLSDFKGKYVYLDFWATWCAPCLQEMRLTVKLKEKYSDQIEFISISTDKHFSTMKEFLKNNKYDIGHIGMGWTFLHYGNYKKVKKDYNIRSIPMYFLIDKDGNLKQSPAKRPSGGIERLFYELTKPKTKKSKVGSKENW